MKKHLALMLLAAPLLSHSAQALDCASLPWNLSMKLGQISPTKARQILKTGDFSVEPKLLQAIPDQELAKAALNLGLGVQKGGNEAMIYAVDAFAYIAKGATELGNANQIAAYQLYQKASGMTDYYDGFQYRTGVRLLAVLRVMGRDEEANLLQAFMQKGGAGGQINLLRDLISNTGHFENARKSAAFCEQILKL